ncbi:MAG TPA: FG-GAP-like repeat-containing protein, partial [Candidatus Binatia bacterium]|nr:FG-GAP-like repeat-containing protein [Candidatus Binatia bacterium]
MRGDSRGVEISALPRSGSPWRLGLGVSRFGRGDSLEALQPGSPAGQGDGLEIGRNGLREWYRTADAGIEYGFRIEHPPVGEPRYGPLKLEVSVTGGLGVAADGCDGCVGFQDFAGRVALQGARIRSTDAAGRDLPTRVVPRDGVIELQIDDAGAIFPIQVDSTLQAPAATLRGETAGDFFGSAIAAAGDVNGDGYGDVIVGAGRYDNGDFRMGRAYLFLGSAEGLETSPSWVVEGSDYGFGFAASVAGAGDVNGDGFADVLVSRMGGAQAYLGSATGLSTSPGWASPIPVGIDEFGAAVAGAGDVNGDGYADLLVGRPRSALAGFRSGSVDLYLGSATGPGTSAAWTTSGERIDDEFGYALAAAGDVNADGYGDVIVGAPGYDYPEPIDRPNAGKVQVYLGSASGLSSFPVWESNSIGRFAFLGFSVSGAGDVNGDGYDD